MEGECPSKKITYTRFIFSFLPITLMFFLLLVLGHQGTFGNLILLTIGIQVIVGVFLVVGEYHSRREDWKNPEPPKKCKEPPETPPWLFWLKVNLGEPLLLYAFYFTFRDIKKGWNAAVERPEFKSSEEHDAIIVMIYTSIGREYHFQEIDLLIEFFIKKKIHYKVYCCKNSSDFFNIINNPKAKKLWIFGHGYRGGVRASDKVVIYSEFVKDLSTIAEKKDFVYQFHCNCGCEKSLVDHLSNGQGFANFTELHRGHVRGYIKNILEDKNWTI